MEKLKKIAFKLLKISGYLVGFIILLFLAIWGALQIPRIQTLAIGKGLSFLPQSISGKIKVGSVDIDFFKTIVLNDVYIQSEQADTLLYAGKLKANIGLFALSDKTIAVDLVSLNNAYINLQTDQKTGKFNFQYILDALTGDTTAVKDTSGTTWTFDMSGIELSNIRFRLNDQKGGSDLALKLRQLSVDIETLGLKGHHLRINDAAINGLQLAYYQFPTDTTYITDTIPQKAEQATSKQQTKPLNATGWQFTVNNLEISNTALVYDVKGTPKAPRGIDYKHLALDNLNIDLEKVYLGPNDLTAKLVNLAFKEKNSGFELNKLAFEANLLMPQASLVIHTIQTPNSAINNGLRLHLASIKDTENFFSQLHAQLRFRHDSVAVRDIQYFTNALDTIPALQGKKLYLDGKLTTEKSNIDFKDYRLAIGKKDFVTGRIQIFNFIPKQWKLATGHIQLREVRTSAGFINSFLPAGTLPVTFDKAGNISLNADIKGSLGIMKGRLNLHSAFGQATTAFALKMDTAFLSQQINANVQLSNFDLEKLLGPASQLGTVTLQADVSAFHASRNQKQIVKVNRAHTFISSLVYNHYTYKNLRVDGSYINDWAEAKLNFDDPNLRLKLLAKVNLGNAAPSFAINGRISKIDLHRLNFTTDTLALATTIQAQASGTNPDQLNGNINLTQAQLITAHEMIPIDSVILSTAVAANGKRLIKLNSDFMDARIAGHFTFAELPQAIDNYVKHYFSVYVVSDKRKLNKPQSLDYVVNVHANPKALEALVKGLKVPQPIQAKGNFISNDFVMNLDLSAPAIQFEQTSIKRLIMDAKTEGETLKFKAKAETLALGDSMVIPEPFISSVIKTDNLLFNIKIAADKADSRLNLLGKLNIKGDTFQVALLPSQLFLNKQPWALAENSAIAYAPQFIAIKNLELAKGAQRIRVNTEPYQGNRSKPMLKVGFDQLIISDIMRILPPLGYNLDGKVNGQVEITTIFDLEKIIANLQIDSVKVNNNTIGTITVRANKISANDWVNLNLAIKGTSNEAYVTGTYNLTDTINALNLKISIARIQLEQIQPLAHTFITDMKGQLTSELTVKGSASKPDIDGYVAFDRATMVKLRMTQVPYTLSNQRIKFSNGQLLFSSFTMKDEIGNPAIINGSIHLSDLQQMVFNLTFDTHEFRLLNTSAIINPRIYGNAYITSNLSITGPLNNLLIHGDVTTLERTNLHMQLGGGTKNVETAGFVTFINRDTIKPQLNPPVATEGKEKTNTVAIEGVTMNLSLKVNPKTSMTIHLAPGGGDQIIAVGSGDFMFKMNSLGVINLQGTYTIDQGRYSLTLFNVIKKEFEIKQGSTITMTGDPGNALFDITAIYKTRAITYDLIADQSDLLSPTALNAVRRPMPVYVDLNINGNITTPAIKFDIELPSEETSIASQVIKARLDEIRSNENQLNKQVFGLITFGRFITESGLGSTERTSESVSRKINESVSQMLSQQLNNFSEEYLGGVEVRVDVKDRPETANIGGATDKQVGLTLSKQFLNDRLRVTIGSNLTPGSTGISNNSAYAQVIGDFSLEYRLDARGNLYMKFFRRNDQNIFTAINTDRIGFTLLHQKNFNSILWLLFPKKYQRKEEEE